MTPCHIVQRTVATGTSSIPARTARVAMYARLYSCMHAATSIELPDGRPVATVPCDDLGAVERLQSDVWHRTTHTVTHDRPCSTELWQDMPVAHRYQNMRQRCRLSRGSRLCAVIMDNLVRAPTMHVHACMHAHTYRRTRVIARTPHARMHARTHARTCTHARTHTCIRIAGRHARRVA